MAEIQTDKQNLDMNEMGLRVLEIQFAVMGTLIQEKGEMMELQSQEMAETLLVKLNQAMNVMEAQVFETSYEVMVSQIQVKDEMMEI